MPNKQLELLISVGSNTELDQEELHKLAQELMNELDELDFVDSVEPLQTGRAPEGAKGLAVDISTVLIKIAEFGGISALITLIGTWLSRDKSRTLKLQLGDRSLELTGLSKAEQEDLIKWFQQQSNLRLDC